MSERILLGGCGDLGRRVAQRLLARGDQVWALRRRPPPHDDSGIHWLRGDLTQPDSLGQIPQDITTLVYLPAPDRRDQAAYRAIFVDGLRHLLAATAAAPLRRVLLISSSAVYGEHGGDWIDEQTPPCPPGFNGEVLLQAEQLLRSARCPTVVLRLAGLYGPGRVQLLQRLRAGQARAPRAPQHWANRIHVDDAATAVAHLLQVDAPLPLYLGVDSTPLPLDTLYDHLAGLMGAPPVLEGPAPSGVGSKRLNNARLRASGMVFRWPDARAGYAALLDR